MQTPGFHIALVEDDPIMGESLAERLQIEGYGVDWYRTLGQARQGLADGPHHAIISDIRLPDGDGASIMSLLHRDDGFRVPVIFITGYGTIDQAVALLKQGAEDYLTKPLDIRELLQRLDQVLVRARAVDPRSGSRALGVSDAMRRVEEQLVCLAAHPDVPVLFHGESGVGKEVAARYLHDLQGHQGPFEAVNCAAIPPTLMAAELFGHEKGAFTGAERRHLGLFERAAGGTAFLDEIGDMPIELQPTLLRILQERRFNRLGGKTSCPVHSRILLATHQDLDRLVAEHRFREDLYYRINVVQVEIPPLRQRRGDIAWLAERFVHRYNQAHPERTRRLSPAATAWLARQDWPGNARELENRIQRACILGQGETLFPEDFQHQAHGPEPDGGTDLNDYLQRNEAEYIVATLRDHDLRIKETAAALGISRKTLWQKMKKYGIDRSGL